MSSVLNSVFRKGIKNRFHLAHRAQSPPSPGSFVSHETNDKPFNPYSLVEASQSSLNQQSARQAEGQPSESSKRISSPKVNVDIGTDGFSLSDWLASELMQQRGGSPAPLPERGASLGATAGTGSSVKSGGNRSVGKGVEGNHVASGSGQSDTGSLSNAGSKIVPMPPPVGEGSHSEVGRGHVRNLSEDDVIVIEAPRGRDPTLSPLSSSFKNIRGAESERDRDAPRRLPPIPVTIPETEVQQRRAASLESSHPNKRTDGSLSPLSQYTSFTRSRSRLHSRSRPSSLHSRYSDTDIDYDDNLTSAVSGTTLARALVSSYILSPTSAPSPGGRSSGRTPGHLARQDSATLPRGELPFYYNRKSLRSSMRSSKGSLAAISRVGSTYWRDRRISGDQIVVMSPDERDGWGEDGDVPPVPPVPAGLSSQPSPHSRSRKPSPNSSEGSQESSAGLTAAWRRSSGSKRRSTDIVLGNVPDMKRRRISKISEVSTSQASSAPGAASIYTAFGSASRGSLIVENDSPQEDNAVHQSHQSQEVSQDDAGDAHGTGHHSQSEQQPDDVPTTTEAATSSQDTPRQDTPVLSLTHSATSAESSLRTPPSAAIPVDHLRPRISRSYSESIQRRALGPRSSVNLLPIGERPRSHYIQSSSSIHPRSSIESVTRPYSIASSLQQSVVPATGSDSPRSPDLIDIMFAGSRVVQGSSGLSGTRVFSPPAPISVPPPESPQFDFLPEGSSSPSTELAGPQTFPETPYAFTPLVSAGFLTPRLPRGTGTPERAITTPLRNGRPPRSGIGRQVLMRHTLAANSPVSAELSTRMPMTPPPSGSDVPLAPLHEAVDALPVPGSADALSMIEECNSPVSHKSQPSLYSNTPEHSPAPLSRSRPISRLSVEVPSVAVAEQPSSLVLTKRSLPSLPSPPPTSFSLPPSPSFSPAEPEHELVEERSGKVADEPLASITENRSDELPENKSASSSSALPSIPVEPFEIVQRVLRARPQPLPPVMSRTTSSVHGTRSRPPPPSGPRRPSGPAFHLSKSRSRNGSVSSSLGSPPANTTTSNAANLLNKGTPPPFSSSSPRFQTQPVKFRGLTLEAAQWTWTREQLQETVSAAIKKSADPSSTRLLSTEVLEEQIPQDIQRLEVLSAELRTNYKLAVRKRRMLLDSLRVIADGGELAEQAVSARLVDDLTDLSDQMSHLSEELYVVTDQLSQLHHLQDIHFGSALAMALHKLNNSLIKHLREKDHLQQQVASLEAERDDGWRHAEEAARELDDLSEKVAMNEGVLTPASSRRSSKISIARKVSVRRAGLRSPSRLRVASNSAIAPPSIRATSGDIPPVPPIPLRTPLALSTSDLPGRSAGLTDDYTPLTPYSETRAMQKAQEELCKMLGISPEDLRGSPIRTHNKRSLSLSATMQNPRNVHSFVSRRKSEIHTPNTGASDGFRIHRHSQNINDRTVVLAAIGMASA